MKTEKSIGKHKKEVECLTCNKKFLVDPWRVGRAKYCSYDCSNKGRISEKSYDKPRICIACKKEYLPTTWYQKFCSRACFNKSEKKTKLTKCKTCKKEFMQVRNMQIFCSRACSSPYRNKKLKKPKQEGLDQLWSKKIKVLAGNKCEYCGKTNGLNSHHIFSRSNRRVRWDLDNGICVCVLHHVFGMFSAHKSPIEFAEWLKEYRGEEWYSKLRVKAKITIPYKKPTKEQEVEIRRTLNNLKELLD